MWFPNLAILYVRSKTSHSSSSTKSLTIISSFHQIRLKQFWWLPTWRCSGFVQTWRPKSKDAYPTLRIIGMKTCNSEPVSIFTWLTTSLTPWSKNSWTFLLMECPIFPKICRPITFLPGEFYKWKWIKGSPWAKKRPKSLWKWTWITSKLM
jgi:hypothetical protein